MSTVEGILIKPDNSVADVTLSDYQDYKAAVDGYIEAVHLVFHETHDTRRPFTMYVNEEYLLGQFDPATDTNFIAMTIAGMSGRVDLVFQRILGPVLIVPDVNPNTGEHLPHLPKSIHGLVKAIKDDLQEEVRYGQEIRKQQESN